MELTQAKVRELFDYRNGRLYWRANCGTNKTKGMPAGTKHKGYRSVQIAQRRYQEHALIFLWHHGFHPTVVDHLDRDPHNNRIENLRAATPAQNSQNASKRTRASSRWKGVSFQASKGWWRTYIQAGRTKRYLGHFRDEADAALAYNLAAAELHGHFAVLNEAQQTCPLVWCG